VKYYTYFRRHDGAFPIKDAMNLTPHLPIRPGAAALWLVAGSLLGLLAYLRAQPDYVPAPPHGEIRRDTSAYDADS
jgi:hypothetical protein